MGFSRQEYWSGLPFPSPGDLPNPGIKPRSPALQADPLPSESFLTDEETAWQSRVLNLGLSEVRNTLFGGWNQLSLQLSYFDYSFM